MYSCPYVQKKLMNKDEVVMLVVLLFQKNFIKIGGYDENKKFISLKIQT